MVPTVQQVLFLPISSSAFGTSGCHIRCGSALGIVSSNHWDMQASMEELSACPGIGPTKVRRLHETFHEPFRRTLQRATEDVPSGEGQPSSVREPTTAIDDALLFD